MQIGADWQTCRYGEIIADQIGSDNRHVYRHILSADFCIGRTLTHGSFDQNPKDSPLWELNTLEYPSPLEYLSPIEYPMTALELKTLGSGYIFIRYISFSAIRNVNFWSQKQVYIIHYFGNIILSDLWSIFAWSHCGRYNRNQVGIGYSVVSGYRAVIEYRAVIGYFICGSFCKRIRVLLQLSKMVKDPYSRILYPRIRYSSTNNKKRWDHRERAAARRPPSPPSLFKSTHLEGRIWRRSSCSAVSSSN